MKTYKKNLLLVLLIAGIAIFPLVFNSGADFEGADDEGGDVIGEIDPDYEPWAEPLWEPPSGEVESLLFSLQIVIGAGTVGYILGTLKEKRKVVNNR